MEDLEPVDSNVMQADQSCKECRRRKGKCDRIIPMCGLCHRYGRHCLYEKHSRTPLTRKHLTEVEERLERAEILIRRLRRSQAPASHNGPCPVVPSFERGLPHSEEAFDFCELDTPGLGPVFGSVDDRHSQTQTGDETPEITEEASRHQPTACRRPSHRVPTPERPREPLFGAPVSFLESPPKDDFEWDEQDATQHQSPESTHDGGGGEDQIADGMASLAVGDKEAGYLGVASGAALLRILEPNTKFRTWRTRANSGTHLPRYAPLSAQPDPNRHIADNMIDAYFRGYHQSYPIVHEPTFRAQYAEVIPQPHGQCWQVLAYTIAAIGAYTSAITPDDLDLALLRHAKALLSFDFLEVGNLTLIQALSLIANYQQKRDKPNSGYNYFGLAVRMATGMGLHKEFPGWNISPLKMEIRRRVWWTLCVFDVGATITFSRPMVWPYEGIEVDYPLNVTDRDLTANSKAYPPERNEVTPYTAVATQARFHMATNPIYARVISKPFPTAQELLRLEEELLEPWRAGLPHYFREGSKVDVGYALAHAVMEWRYWNFRIIMYRPFVIRMALKTGGEGHEETGAPNMQAYERCLADARATILSITEYWSQGQHNRLEAWYALYFLFQASLIPCICLRNGPSSPEAPSWCDQVSKTLRTIRAMAPTNPSSERCYPVIVELCGQYLSGPDMATTLHPPEKAPSSEFRERETRNRATDVGYLLGEPQEQPGPIGERLQTQLNQILPMMWPNVSTLETMDEVMGEDAWLDFLRAGHLDYSA